MSWDRRCSRATVNGSGLRTKDLHLNLLISLSCVNNSLRGNGLFADKKTIPSPYNLYSYTTTTSTIIGRYEITIPFIKVRFGSLTYWFSPLFPSSGNNGVGGDDAGLGSGEKVLRKKRKR